MGSVVHFNHKAATVMFVDFANTADIDQQRTVNAEESLAQLFFQTFQRKIAEVGFKPDIIFGPIRRPVELQVNFLLWILMIQKIGGSQQLF